MLFQEEMDARLAEVDLALMPPAPSTAPNDGTTGKAIFNSPWSLCGIPAISLPTQLSQAGLPLGVQMIGREAAEETLLAHAAWLESLIGFNRAPG
jgi:aspartyl-tRNA(Asn)/glutamyl-tRNA(Gln) amidotransferase subunit A